MSLTIATPQIRWHIGDDDKNAPVQSADFHPSEPVLATGAADSNVHLWRMSATGQVEFIFCLSGHQKGVNVVRFSPNGDCIASASDDGLVVVWYRNPMTTKRGWTWSGLKSERELQRLQLRGHAEDIYDLAWSPDSRHIISGCIDHHAIVWDVPQRVRQQTLDAHTHYVQGVAWDPRNRFVATASVDRSCRVYARGTTAKAKAKGGWQASHIINRRKFALAAALPEAETCDGVASSPAAGAPKRVPKEHRMFQDESANTCFRRPCFSPDGSLFFAPSGVFQAAADQPQLPSVYVFASGRWSEPLAHFPALEGAKPSVAVRCCPVLFQLRKETTEAPTMDLPYRIVFAVISVDSIIVYDTQHREPLFLVANTHYASLTDAAWSPDGHRMIFSSQDGYCSIVNFGEGLGAKLAFDDVPESMKAPKGPTFEAAAPPRAPAAAPSAAGPTVVHAPPVRSAAAAAAPSAASPAAAPAAADATALVSAKLEDSAGVQTAAASEPSTKKRRVTPMLISSVSGSPLPSAAFS